MSEEGNKVRISAKDLRLKWDVLVQIIVSAIVIVSVIFSALYLISKKNATNLQKAAEEAKRLQDEADKNTASKAPCAIEIHGITAGDKILFPLAMSGTIDSSKSRKCGWSIFEGTAGTVTIMDTKGNIIAGPEQITLEKEWLDLILTQKQIEWSSHLDQLYKPETTEGFARFESVSMATGDIEYTFDLPIKF